MVIKPPQDQETILPQYLSSNPLRPPRPLRDTLPVSAEDILPENFMVSIGDSAKLKWFGGPVQFGLQGSLPGIEFFSVWEMTNGISEEKTIVSFAENFVKTVD